MANTTKRPIGKLKSKVTVYCTICGCENIRKINVFVFENTKEEIEKIKSKLTERGNKKYTCRICKSIKKGN